MTVRRKKPALPEGVPEPLRELGPEGMRAWLRVWTLGSPWIRLDADIELVTILCESIDERSILRLEVLENGEWRDRVALRTLDDQIMRMMGDLGLNPMERAKLDIVEGPKGRLAELRAARAAAQA